MMLRLVERALQGLETSRVPVGPLAVHYCAKVGGVSVRAYTTNPRVMAECVVRYYERFRPDAVWVSADTWVSAQAMGAAVGAGTDEQPFGGLASPLIQQASDLARIPAPEVGSQGRYPLMLEALSRVVQALGDEVFVVACLDQFPFSLAAALMGLDGIMVKLAEDRPLVEAVMERCLEYGLAYGRALSEAGADMLSGGDSPASLIGLHTYRELVQPFERRLIEGLKAAAPQPVSLHICGDALRLLTDMAGAGADVLEIDHQVDLARACELVSPEVALWGNLDPVSLLAQESAERVKKAAREALEVIRAAGRRRFVLSSGCTLAMETPAENLDALMRCES